MQLSKELKGKQRAGVGENGWEDGDIQRIIELDDDIAIEDAGRESSVFTQESTRHPQTKLCIPSLGLSQNPYTQ